MSNSVTALGTGGSASYTLSPTSLSFVAQRLGTTSPGQSVTLTNTGTLALPVTRIALGGTTPGQFSQINDCGSSVAVGTDCTITVTFRPTSTGAKSASLSVATGDGAGTQSVALSGTGR